MFILSKFSALIYEMASNKPSKMKDGGAIKSNKLLAPNGKPTNLTSQQYALVRTPAFKKWFGDWENDPENASKVVDENGEPLVCYHYSPKEFVIFDKKQHPKIANFVENKYHKHLGYDFSTKKGFFQTKDSFEYKVFLNVRNIFNIKYATEKQFEPLIKILSSIPYYSHYEYRKSDLERDIQELKKGQWDSLELPSIEKYLSKKYDGLIMYERDWENIKVYSEKNIKLADGTNTTFDANNSDIRFEGGGKVEYKNEKQKIINSIDYLALQKFIKNELSNRIDLDVIKKETRKFIDKIFSFKNSDNTIFIYRNMYVDSDYLNKLLNGEEVKLGHYWSYDKDKAESWDVADTLNKKRIIICAKVDFNKIDWEHTIYLYYTFGGEETESELALKNKRPNSKFTENIDVELVYVEVDDEKLYWDESERKKYKLKQGGNILLAPNGKPSNLTPEQYKLVRTPAFKAWFGDWENDPENASKVVDENGEPLVVYHGVKPNRYAFNVFEIYNEGAFFTEREYVAKRYSSNYDETEFGVTKALFLNIRKPEYIKSVKYKHDGYSGADANLKKRSEKMKEKYPEFKNTPYRYKDLVREQSKKKGHDGFILENHSWGEGIDNAKQYAVFEPNQIKLADGTNTTFDTTSPDIRFQDGGQV
jgi:hypothetical protein